MSPATLFVYVSDQLACIKIVGRANFNSSLDFKTLVKELIDRKFKCIVLDLAECVLMDSTFLGVLAGSGLRMRAEEGTDSGRHPIELLNPNPRIEDLLENLGVLPLFKIITGPMRTPNSSGEQVVPPGKATREEIMSTCLEAHKLLMEIDPSNVPKFKEVTQFLAEDLKKLQNSK